MRLLMIIILFLLTACDSESAAPAQADSDKSLKKDNVTAEDIIFENVDLESANGLNARLMYDYNGAPMPTDSFRAPDGSSLTLERYKGRPILLNLWATFCVPCRVEMPTLDNLAAIEEGNISVITVSQDLTGREVVSPYFERYGFQNIQAFTDRPNALLRAVGEVGLPATILYDSEGKEVWRVVGGLEWDDETVAELIRQAR